jgi:hypothetical protein
MSIRNQFIVAGTIGAAIGAGVGGLNILVSWFQVSAYGSRSLGLLPMLFTLPLMGAFLAVPPCLILLFFPETRLWAGRILLTAVMALTVAIPLMPLAGTVRMRGFHQLAFRSAPLVHALAAYTTDHGNPPETLNALIPDYIQKIPSTGMGAYPAYQYAAGDEARKWNDNPWVLSVETSRGFLNWDRFIYFPMQNYPATGYGGSLERIGEWAYVHE